MPPSPQVLALMKLAAELRVGGGSWETVAAKVQRSARTCQRWPDRYPQEWDRLFRLAETKSRLEVRNEALLFLRKFCRDQEDKWLAQDSAKFLYGHGEAERAREAERAAADDLFKKWGPTLAQLEAMNEHERKEFLDDLVARRERHDDPARPGRAGGAGAAQPG